MATLDTHKAVTKLQDAGAPEPLATATVEVVEEAADQLVGKEYLRAELNRQLYLIGGAVFAIVAAVAGVSLAIAGLLL